MSDRSAKLLLEVARTIEQKSERSPCVKLSGTYDVPINVGLVSDIEVWAQGYRGFIKQRGQ